MKYPLVLMMALIFLLSACSGILSNKTANSAVASTQAAQLTATAMVSAGSATSPSIGMTPDQVLNMWGYPEEIHQDTVYGEQWTYPNNVTIYFQNGAVSKIQQ